MTNLGPACSVALMKVVISYSTYHDHTQHMYPGFRDVPQILSNLHQLAQELQRCQSQLVLQRLMQAGSRLMSP